MLGLQRGALPPQRDRLVGVHCTQLPVSGATWAQKGVLGHRAHWLSVEHGSHTALLLQTGFGFVHGAPALQLAQLCSARSQLSVAQSDPQMHCTHWPFMASFESVTHTPPPGLQSALPLAAVHVRQSRVVASQNGVDPEQSALLRQPTQVSVAVSQ